jgi:hypothetical protein
MGKTEEREGRPFVIESLRSPNLEHPSGTGSFFDRKLLEDPNPLSRQLTME